MVGAEVMEAEAPVKDDVLAQRVFRAHGWLRTGARIREQIARHLRSLERTHETTVVAFRKHTLLPLDDCLYALQATIPHLTRSSLHRCLQRHGIGRLPEVVGDKPAKRPFKAYPIGYFHIDIAEVRTEEGKLHLFVAVDRTSKYAFARLMQKATVATARTFLNDLVKAVPYKIHTVLTDNGIQFADLPKNRSGPTATWRGHPFDRTCRGMASSIVSPSSTISAATSRLRSAA